MRICINLPGTIEYGLFSPERGESRWSQNLAYVLASRDWNVWCTSVACPSWGNKFDKTPTNVVKNIKFCTLFEAKEESKKEEFDILFDTSWFHPGMTNFYKDFETKVFIHGHWGGCCYEEPGRFPGPNHYIAYPNLQVATSMTSCSFKHLGKHLFVPIPLLRERNIGGDRKGIVWGIREGFFARKGKRLIDRALFLLKFLSEYADSDYVLYIMNSNEMFNAPENDKIIVESGVLNWIKEAKNVVLLDKTPYDEVLDILAKSVLLIRTGDPPGAPLEYEAISQGCLPVIWKGGCNVFERYYDTFGLTLSDEGIDDNSPILFEKLRVLVESELVRKELLRISEGELLVHYDYDFIEGQLKEVIR